MAARIRITEAELRDGLAEALRSGGPTDAQTVAELVETTTMVPSAVRRALRAYARQGRLVVHRVHRPAIDGRAQQVPAYTITPAPKKAT